MEEFLFFLSSFELGVRLVHLAHKEREDISGYYTNVNNIVGM